MVFYGGGGGGGVNGEGAKSSSAGIEPAENSRHVEPSFNFLLYAQELWNYGLKLTDLLRLTTRQIFFFLFIVLSSGDSDGFLIKN